MSKSWLEILNKVDKIYRDGLKAVPDQKYLKKLQAEYDCFADRMQQRINSIMPLDNSNKNKENNNQIKRKRHDEDTISLASYIVKSDGGNWLNPDAKLNKVAGIEKRGSYTSEHIYVDAWKIFIDVDQRKNVIPRGASLVDEYYRLLDMENQPYGILLEKEDPDKYEAWFYDSIDFSTFRLRDDSNVGFEEVKEVITYNKLLYNKEQCFDPRTSIEEVRAQKHLYNKYVYKSNNSKYKLKDRNNKSKIVLGTSNIRVEQNLCISSSTLTEEAKGSESSSKFTSITHKTNRSFASAGDSLVKQRKWYK